MFAVYYDYAIILITFSLELINVEADFRAQMEEEARRILSK